MTTEKINAIITNELLNWVLQELDSNQNTVCLYRKYIFSDFSHAMLFMNKAAGFCEQINHHPRWRNEYNIVEVWLRTWDESCVGEKDVNLAKEMDRLVADI